MSNNNSSSKQKEKTSTEHTLLKLLQQAEANEEGFRTIIETSTNATQLVSATGKMLYTTESIKNVLGYSPEELKGCPN